MAPDAQTRSVPFKRQRILGGGKGVGAPNRCQLPQTSGAQELSAPLFTQDKYLTWKWLAPIKAPGAQTRSVPIKQQLIMSPWKRTGPFI